MIDLVALNSEITIDPISRNYAAMSDAEIAHSGNNVIDREKNRTSVSPGEMQRAVVGAEFIALSAGAQRGWLAILSDAVDPNNANTIAQIAAIWAAGTATRTNLVALKKEPGSRAEELDLGAWTPSNVTNAKRL